MPPEVGETSSAKPRRQKKGIPKTWSDAAILERVQAVLVNAASGRRSLSDDQQYSDLRKAVMRRLPDPPTLVVTHPTVDSFSAYIKGIENRQSRVQRVYDEFAPLLELRGHRPGQADASQWTGSDTRTARLKTVRTLLPLAQAAVESMIEALSDPGANNGPILDEREEAIEHLRALHRTLGELLAAVEADRFDDELGQGLAADAARYAKRAARALRDDPMPYLSGALLLGIFEACGFPGIAGYIAGVASNIGKHRQKPMAGD